MESKITQGNLDAFGVKSKYNGEEIFYYFSYLGLERLNTKLREKKLTLVDMTAGDPVAAVIAIWAALSHYEDYPTYEEVGEALLAEAREMGINFVLRVAQESVKVVDAFTATEKEKEDKKTKRPLEKKKSKKQ